MNMAPFLIIPSVVFILGLDLSARPWRTAGWQIRRNITMASVNKAILIGNLGADPETRFTQGGQAVSNFRIATSEKWSGKDGQQKESTEWHRIVTFGKLAETCRDYLSKGRQVYVEGRIQTRQWDDRDGNKRYTTEVVAQTVRFLGQRSDRDSNNQGGGYQAGGYGGSSQGGGQGQGQGGSQGQGGDQGGSQGQGGGSSDYDGGPPPIADEDVPF